MLFRSSGCSKGLDRETLGSWPTRPACQHFCSLKAAFLAARKNSSRKCQTLSYSSLARQSRNQIVLETPKEIDEECENEEFAQKDNIFT